MRNDGAQALQMGAKELGSLKYIYRIDDSLDFILLMGKVRKVLCLFLIDFYKGVRVV